MDQRYGAEASQKIPDQQWIEEATLNGDVLLCKDVAIAANPLEAQAVYMAGARVFALSNAQLPWRTMAEWFVSHEAKIVKAAERANGPYVMAINPAYGLKRRRLSYPPT